MSFELAKKHLVEIIILIVIIAIAIGIVVLLIIPRITGETGLTAQQKFTRLCGEWNNNDCDPDYFNSNNELQNLCKQLYPIHYQNDRCESICVNNCNPITPVQS